MHNKFLLAIIFLFLLRIFFSFGVYHPDLGIHMDWGIRVFDYGTKGFYGSDANVWSFAWPNQPPGTILMLIVIRRIFEFIFSILWFININFSIFPSAIVTFAETNLYPSLIKFPAIIADFGIAFLIYKFLSKEGFKKARFGALLFLVNPVIWYNSSIWGQTDSIVNFLILLSLYFYVKKLYFYIPVLIALSLYIKLSMLIFVPVFLVLFLMERKSLKKVFLSSIFSVLLVTILSTPFSNGNPLFWLYKLYIDKILVEQLHLITANAFNFWAIFEGSVQSPNSNILFIFSYEIWGIILFVLSIIPAFYILLKDKSDNKNFMYIWVFALIAFCSFYFLTNMHERYLYPLFPYLTILAVKYKKVIKIYIAISIIQILNLYNLWWRPTISPVIEIMTKYDDLIFRSFGFISLILLFILYYRFININYFKKA